MKKSIVDVIESEVISKADEYKPSEKEMDVLDSVFFKFREVADNRDKNYEYFDGLNLIEYIEDSVRRFTTNVDERESLEDWQARVFDPFTRNKVLAFLGKIVQVLPIAQFSGRGDEDARKGTIVTNLYEYFEELDDYEELMIYLLLECIVKGTAIGYEGIDYKVRKIRNVKGFNDNITIKEEKETITHPFGAIVPLEDFYPSSVAIRNIKKMPYCFWRTILNESEFLMYFGSYDKSQYVKPKMTVNADNNVERPYYIDYISEDVTDGQIEVIRYYDRVNDEFIILANGIWINPLNKDIISPLPFNHKELPFWDIKFDFFGEFFYGKSLPDRLKSMQDVLNVLTNMLLDQSFLTIFPPLLTNGLDPIEDDYLRPGRRTSIDTQGQPISSSFMKLDLGTPAGWHQYILEYTRKIMEQSSMDQVSQGQAGVGGRTTASEIRTAAEGVTALLGIFARMVNYGIKRKALLKASNILQIVTEPGAPVIKRVGGDTGKKDFNEAFNVFKIDNAVLSKGKRGTKVIEIYSNKSKMPTKKTQIARAQIAKADLGKEIEFIALPPSYLRNFLFDVKLGTNPKNEQSKELAKALHLEKVRVYMSFFPNIMNVQELAAETAEMMGDDPTKVINADAFAAPVEPGTETDTGVGKTPQGNTANNMVRGMQGGEVAGNDMQALQSAITG